MNTKADIRGYVNPYVPGAAEATQKASMPSGAEVYTEDRSGKQIDALIRTVRKGSVVAVFELYCLAPGSVRRADKRRRVLTERWDAIKAKGGKLMETCGVERSPSAMLLHAYEQIATSGRARKQDREGRPGHLDRLSAEQRKAVEAIWHSRKYKTGTEALAAIHALGLKWIKRSWLYTHFGRRD